MAYSTRAMTKKKQQNWLFLKVNGTVLFPVQFCAGKVVVEG